MRLNIAARAGRWSAAHWKTAVAAWLAFCVVAVALGAVAGTKMLKQADTAAGGTKKAEQFSTRRLSEPRARERARSSRTRRRSAIPAFARPSPTSSAPSRAAERAARALAARAAATPARLHRTGARRSSSSRSPATRTRRTRRCSQSSTRSIAFRRGTPGFTVAEFGFASANARAEQDAEQGLLSAPSTRRFR